MLEAKKQLEHLHILNRVLKLNARFNAAGDIQTA